MKTLSELGLSKEEIDFVELVYLNPNCKLHECRHYIDEKNTIDLYKKPEQLGLIKCVGSYKWIVTDKVKIMFVVN